jgi:hypothetical protein
LFLRHRFRHEFRHSVFSFTGKVEWLGLESRLKMTAGGWYHTVCSGSLATPRVVLSGLLRTVVGQFGFFGS